MNAPDTAKKCILCGEPIASKNGSYCKSHLKLCRSSDLLYHKRVIRPMSYELNAYGNGISKRKGV